jgi:multidrug efflux pump
MKIIEHAINRSRTTLSIMAIIILAGLNAYMGIPLASQPDVEVPVIIVTIPHEGISPEDAERLLAKPMEVELRNIEGIDEISTYSGEGSATAVVEFEFPFDSDKALMDVREAVDKVKGKIPSTSEEPFIQEISAGEFAVIIISLGGEGVSERLIYNLALKLSDKIEVIPDVLSADLQGHREELLEAIVDPAQLEVYGITNQELIRAVNANNRLIAAGSLDTGKGSFSVKVPGLLENAKDVLDLPIKATAEGVITLSDVTRVRRTFKDATNYTRANGVNAISLEVSKRQSGNLIDVVDRIQAVVEKERLSYPNNVTVSYQFNQAPEMVEQIDSLQGNISTAMFLVLTIVVAAVGLRSGFLVALAIPVSFLFAFIVINALGYSYNFMVMFGLLLALGMLIDGAIVVVEFADRKMAEGKSSHQAYVFAMQRMFWPVIGSTLTTLAAFLPLMFWPGVAGGFMKYLPVTVFAVLAGSLAYALVFVPVLGAMFGKVSSDDEAVLGYLNTLENGDVTKLGGITGVYARILQFTVSHPLIILTAAVFILYSIVSAYGAYGRGMQFFTDVDPTYSGVGISVQGNFSAQETLDIVVDVERRIAAAGHLQSYYTRTGGSGFSMRGGGGSADTVGMMQMELSDRRTRDVTGREVLALHREAIKDVPGVRAEVIELEMGPPVGKDIQIQLEADEMDVLIRETHRIKDYLINDVDGLISIDDTAPVPGIEWQVTVDRASAAMLGADITAVGTAIQLLTNGVLVGYYRPDDAEDEVDIRVRYPENQRGIHQLDQLRVNTASGMIPISSFVKREAKSKVSSIHRLDGKRVMFVRAGTEEDVLASDKVDEISEWLQGADIDPSVTVTFRGANEEQEKSMQFIGKAFLFSLFLMGVLLVTQFNSFYQALLILSAVVMSTVGVLLGLLILNQTFSAIMTGVGVVALAGIIVNNNIVLIDTFNVLREQNTHERVRDVIIRTGVQRLRPVFLTTFTTGFGLLPMASGISVDLIGRKVEIGGPVASQFLQLSSAIVSGLTFATVLTLIVTPALLMLPHTLRSMWSKTDADKNDGASKVSGIPTLTVPS